MADLYDSPTSDVEVPLSLFERTEGCQFGRCDAFLSHSWHDSAEAKWKVLQNWRGAFISKHGREPRIWFDKACIDQTDIESDLRGLPIFLASCNELLVLCGPTYLERLWCVVELFTFVHIGGTCDKVTVAHLVREGYEDEDEDAIQYSIEHFDANQCQCFNNDDKEKMLEIIKAAFIDIGSFHVAVRELMEAICFLDISSDSASSTSSMSFD